MPSASVIIRKYTPVARSATSPKIAATAAASSTPTTSVVQNPAPYRVARMPDAVGAEPEIGRVAERGQPGVAEDDVQAHGENRRR